MEGFLLIDKPAGMTSHDVVDAVRRVTGIKRVGHAGTLDPFATGLLLVGVGRTATREFPKLVGLDKDYEATFVLGASSDTDDRTGKITPDPGFTPPTDEQLAAAIPMFTGEIEQQPPTYSAIKIGGKKMYEAAREGKPLVAKSRRVTISRFELVNRPSPERLQVVLSVSSGTYIRAIARDLGRALGTGWYVEELRRTRIGPLQVQNAVSLEHLGSSKWQEALLASAALPLLE